MIEGLTTLHFLRPLWLWALLALPLLALWWRVRRKRESVWRDVVDPHLLPHLLQGVSSRGAWTGLWASLLALAVAILALAGPAWRLTEQPLWQTEAPLVIALDLSSAITTPDLPPSRLLQARAKITTLLRERAGGQVGLVAFAGDAFTVAPLTDDVANVALFLDALAPDVMPVDGSRADRAIEISTMLLRQAGFDHGDILVLSDHADADARSAATKASGAGYRVSALGLGTAAGAAYRKPDGSIAQARLEASSLQALAAAGGGAYAALTANNSDLAALGILDPQHTDAAAARGEKGKTWQDEGYWLLLPLMLLALFAFRRGGSAVAASLLLLVVLPMAPAHAQQTNLWQRPDQQQHARMQQGTQAYRKGDFVSAEKSFTGIDKPDAHYNRGNALAKAGRYEEAIAAYDAALGKQPGMQDAIANKRAVEAAMKRKPPKGPKHDNRGRQDQQQNGQQQPGGQPSPSQDKPGQQDSEQTQQKPPQGSPQDGNDNPRETKPQNAAVKPEDGQAQRNADAAQRQSMQRALERGGKQTDQGRDVEGKPDRAESAAEREQRQMVEAWLKRVPDDPGGLLRRKFALEYERRLMQGEE
ncbi:MAG: VWA domain-containing protein [Lysobacter sp.]|nr:VWA domain-containing protein [Lysobacter sp.]